jgi:hypothetical protein
VTPDDPLDELRAALSSARLLDALRREHRADLVCAIETLTRADGPARQYLLGHAAELADDLPAARRHYEAAQRIAVDLGATNNSLVTTWWPLQIRVIRARLGDRTLDLAEADELARAVLGRARSTKDPILIAHAATAAARLVLARSGRRGHDVALVLGELTRATTAAEAAIQEREGWERARAAEAFAPLQLAHLRLLFAMADDGASTGHHMLAWQRFRTMRQNLDLLPGPELRWPLTNQVPADTCVLELLALPGDRLRVCVTTANSQRYGASDATTEEASRLQLAFAEELRLLSERALAPRESSIELCGWTWRVAAAWTSLLLERDVRWQDGIVATLAHVLEASPFARLCVIPHGPTQSVPWGLQRVDGEAWLERWSVEICTSWRRAPAMSATTPSDLVELELPVAAASTEGWPAIDQAEVLFDQLAGQGRAWISGHGRFLPPTHGDSTLLTLGAGDVLSLRLPDMIAAARRASVSERRPRRSILVSICEAGEVSLRSFVSEFITLAHAFLVAGAPTVVAPLWSTTNLCDHRFRAVLRGDEPLGRSMQTLLRDELRRWRVCSDRDAVVRIARECLAQRHMLLCDIGAFHVYGYIQPS